MTEKKSCPKCENELPGNAPAGVCPRCLLLAGMGESSPEMVSAATDVTILTDLAEPSEVASDVPTVHAGASSRNVPSTGAKVRYFGEYELLTEIARGGMGVVYRARQVRLNRIVALKMILAGQFASQADVQRFHTEAESAAQLDHPGIVPIYEVGEHDGHHFFTMGFVDGESLAARLLHGPLAPREAALLVQQIAEAVQYAHEHGVIHRDLKPANILLDRAGQPRVSDFGLAKNTHHDSGLTASGQVMGTPSYMPPEQASGNTSPVNEAADVYSVGAILYALLTGRPPFQADTVFDTLKQVSERDPVAPSALNAKVPQDLETICLKCLEKDRRRRFQSARELVEELRRFLDGRPILSRRVSVFEHVWRWCRRHPAIAALTAGIAASLVIGTLVSLSFARQAAQQALEARRSATLAVREKQRADDEAKQAVLNARRADQQARVAKANEKRANEAQRIANRRLYAAQMNLAQVAWEETRVAETLRLLELYRPIAGETDAFDDLRGFEWHYWNRLAHSYLMNLQGHTDGIMSVTFSPDGKLLASVGKDATVRIWDAANGQEKLALKGGHSSVVFSSDGKRLAAASGNGMIKVWDATTGQETRTLKGEGIAFTSVAVSPDGKMLASAGYDRKVRVWDASTGQETLVLTWQLGGIRGNSVAFSPDGKSLASSFSNTVKVWDVPGGRELLTLSGNTSEVLAVTYSPDGKRLATANVKGSVKLWDSTSGQELLTLDAGTEYVWSIVFSPDGKRLATTSADTTVRVWDADNGQPTLTLKGHTGPVMSVAFSPDGTRLASASSDQTVKVWDVSAGQEPLTLRGSGYTGQFISLSMSADAKRVAVSSDVGNVTVWEVPNSQPSHTLSGPQYFVPCVALSPDGKRLAAPGFESLKVWDAASGRELLNLKGAGGSVTFSSDGKRLAATSGQIVKVWDAATGQEQLTLKHAAGFMRVVFSPDGKWLATPFWDGTIRVWDSESGQEARSWKGHAKSIISVTYSPDGKWLATGGEDQTVRIWEVESGRELLTLKGHTREVKSVAFSPDGKRLASGGDTTVKVWDTASGQETLTLKHKDWISGVAFSADGYRLVSASGDATVKVWDATPRP